jgi:exodeoxyribonuclease V alpha subunit
VAKAPLESILALQKIWVATAISMTHDVPFAVWTDAPQVTTLVERFGSQAVPILERDPYVLMREVAGFGFKRVDKIARMWALPRLPSRIRAGIQYCVLDALTTAIAGSNTRICSIAPTAAGDGYARRREVIEGNWRR